MLSYSRYKFTRFWAVYEGDELLCITVYLKGALAVIKRISSMRPVRPRRKKKTNPLPAAPKPPTLRDPTRSHILDTEVNTQGDDGKKLETLAHIEALAREGLNVSPFESQQPN